MNVLGEIPSLNHLFSADIVYVNSANSWTPQHFISQKKIPFRNSHDSIIYQLKKDQKYSMSKVMKVCLFLKVMPGDPFHVGCFSTWQKVPLNRGSHGVMEYDTKLTQRWAIFLMGKIYTPICLLLLISPPLKKHGLLRIWVISNHSTQITPKRSTNYTFAALLFWFTPHLKKRVVPFELRKKKNSYFPLYWMVYRDPYIGLLNPHIIG